MPAYDPIEQSRRYAFGETETHYGVWDKQAGTELVDQFPLTDEGFDRASALFDELKRRDRRERASLLYVLWFAMVAGVLAMVVGGVMELLGTVFDVELFLATTLAFSLGNIGYSVALGGLVLLLGLTLIRRDVGRRATASSEVVATANGSATSRALWWVMLTALVVWVLSAIASQLLFPLDFFDEVPTTASRVSLTIESVAFRIWAALLAIWWGRRLLARQTAGDAPAAG